MRLSLFYSDFSFLVAVFLAFAVRVSPYLRLSLPFSLLLSTFVERYAVCYFSGHNKVQLLLQAPPGAGLGVMLDEHNGKVRSISLFSAAIGLLEVAQQYQVFTSTIACSLRHVRGYGVVPTIQLTFENGKRILEPTTAQYEKKHQQPAIWEYKSQRGR